jgi:hypothetical protein
MSLSCTYTHAHTNKQTQHIQVFGKRIGSALQSWHQSMGVQFENASTVERVDGADGKVVTSLCVVLLFLSCFAADLVGTDVKGLLLCLVLV